MELLRQALAGHPDRSPEESCQAVLDELLPERPKDDVALLIARTRGLPARPDRRLGRAARSGRRRRDARRRSPRKLDEWGLSELAFTMELVLSELITNAIRYGSEPIRVRLLHDRTLICEVSDGSSTSPHLRYAATMDEGGRGLFLVAQLAERWGTRYTPQGKVIWAEQALPEVSEESGPAAAPMAEEAPDRDGAGGAQRGGV